VKLTSLAVITLLVVFGCSGAAFAQGSFALGFESAGGLGEYCNYEVIQYGPGSENNFYMQGVDNTQNACFYTYNATIEGVKVSVSATDNAPVTGAAYAYADNIYDVGCICYTGDQWFVITLTKPSKLLHKFGWVGYAGFSGLEFLGNYGYLTATLPGDANSKPNLGVTNAAVGKKSQIRTIKQ